MIKLQMVKKTIKNQLAYNRNSTAGVFQKMIFFKIFATKRGNLLKLPLEGTMTNKRKENGQAKVCDRKEHRATPGRESRQF